MAARFLLRPGAALKLAAIGTAGAVVYPASIVHAEAQSSNSDEAPKTPKPIYDDSWLLPPSETPSTSTPSSQPSSDARKPTNTPTDRLTTQIARARLFLHKYAAKSEDAANDALTRSFDLEKSFTGTIASLAPPKETGEKLMPGLIYVLVSAMGSSILVRNRNILLRASFPLAVGIGAGYYFIPVTMENVGELVWSYEKRFPALADTHIRAKDRVTTFVQTGIAHSKMSVGMLEDKVSEAREGVEQWVSKGN